MFGTPAASLCIRNNVTLITKAQQYILNDRTHRKCLLRNKIIVLYFEYLMTWSLSQIKIFTFKLYINFSEMVLP